MAKKNVDLAAAKAKKQKKLLIVFGVLLLVVGAIQGPKLMKSGSKPAATPVGASGAVADGGSTADAGGASGGSPTTTPTTTPTPKTGGGKPAGYVAGVGLPGSEGAQLSAGQLASFTLFEGKDPFVPGYTEQPPSGDTISSGSPSGGTTPEAPSANLPSAAAPAGSPSPPAKPAPKPAVLFATINLDGKPEQVKVKGSFPESDPLFVLVSLKAKQAKIGVAGGSFDDGKTVTLAFGKKLTLVNTATGVRYVLKLVYAGAAPETIAGFTTGPTGSATSSSTSDSSTTSASDSAATSTSGTEGAATS